MAIALLSVLACLCAVAFLLERFDAASSSAVAPTDTTTSAISPSPADPGSGTPSTPSGAGGGEGQRQFIEGLLTEVRPVPTRPAPPGYDRECSPGYACVFGTDWTDATTAPQGHNGCDTRNDVLAAQLDGVAFSTRSPECDVVAGILMDPYTAQVVDYSTDGSQIHIDHLFPLAAAWDLGAHAWTQDEREAFANDVALELVATSASANLQKGDSTPSSWLPVSRAYRCTYVERYLRVAVAYDLALTDADIESIGFTARGC